jgi:small nuclear ribonucleoprotein (snRNP)-like protein
VLIFEKKMKKDLEKYLQKEIVLDTRSSWVYIGVLEEVTEKCAVLSDADVHDNKDISTTKELYVLGSKSSGIKANRNRVHVNLDFVISFSSLDEVKFF